MRGAAPLPAGETRLPGPHINAAAHARLAKKYILLKQVIMFFQFIGAPGH